MVAFQGIRFKVTSVSQLPIVWLKPKEGTSNEEILTKGIGTDIFLNLQVLFNDLLISDLIQMLI